jgi:hypothetical protein
VALHPENQPICIFLLKGSADANAPRIDEISGDKDLNKLEAAAHL